MLEIRMRPKHQITLPANIVRQAKLATDDRLEVTYTNGVIVLTPHPAAAPAQAFNVMSYAGIGEGMWGQSADEVNQYISDLRS
jgi:bifunctional DNA-binding transcriptional regulator/antitoxin component of YhaV-PrlF toxin-antitoxin module